MDSLMSGPEKRAKTVLRRIQEYREEFQNVSKLTPKQILKRAVAIEAIGLIDPTFLSEIAALSLCTYAGYRYVSASIKDHLYDQYWTNSVDSSALNGFLRIPKAEVTLLHKAPSNPPTPA